MGQLNQEPSMEDILASIKRIIAEDSEVARAPRVKRGPVAVPDPVEPDGDVAIAPVDEPPIVDVGTIAEPPASQHAVEEPADVLELTSPLIDPEPAPMIPATSAAPDTVEPAQAETPGDASGPILSGATAVASRQAFSALAALQVRSEEGNSNTLEGLVADLLKPMLREWLDRELPALVERLVQDEIKRVSGRA